MDIRFDPRLPLVWRDPETLQIGVDRPRVVVQEITGAQERLVSAIVRDRGRGGLPILAREARCPEAEAARFVEVLRPALLTSRVVTVPVVALSGDTAIAEALSSILIQSGVDVRRVASGTDTVDEPAALGIAVADHVHDPLLSAAWLRRDVPHLQVVRGDAFCRVGPVVVPGRTACARCLDLHRGEVDDAWGVIAAQLAALPAAAADPVVVHEVAARSARRVLARLAGTPPADALIEMVSLETGEVTRSWSRPHPSCGCAALPEICSGDARASPGSVPAVPTTGSGGAGRG